MRNGEMVGAFEREFAAYVDAKYAIALCNGTATLHTALVALGVKPGDKVAVPPLTHSATTIAVLHAGAIPVFADVDPKTWLMEVGAPDIRAQMPVSLYGLHARVDDWRDGKRMHGKRGFVVDAAQTLQPMEARPGRSGYPEFQSYSFQASKILALGEGGMLVTNDEGLATKAREFSSLGYRMKADQPRIDPEVLKASDYERHYSLGWNYRMADYVAHQGYYALKDADTLIRVRQEAAGFYREAIEGCNWISQQHVPEGYSHNYWTHAVATDTPEQQKLLSDAVVKHGGERPYSAWRLTYDEPAFTHLRPGYTPLVGRMPTPPIFRQPICPVAESLQPRLLQLQTNNLESAQKNADALHRAIREIG